MLLLYPGELYTLLGASSFHSWVNPLYILDRSGGIHLLWTHSYILKGYNVCLIDVNFSVFSIEIIEMKTYNIILYLFFSSDIYICDCDIIWTINLFYHHDNQEVFYNSCFCSNFPKSYEQSTVGRNRTSFYWARIGQCIWQRKER
jgi:hypothetical protein